MSQYWNQNTRDLTPYVPGEQPQIQGLIKLNTNENPYPPSPAVDQAVNSALAKLHLYPDPNATVLKQTIASYNGLNENQVFVGNGSDEVLALLFKTFFSVDKPVLFPDITYSFYPVYCNLYDLTAERVPLDDNLQINVNDYTAEASGIIFANPNAPTGDLLPLADIERLLQARQDVVVVVDEAYVDFGGESAVSLIDRYANLLVVQTLSKSRSLAGLRVGFAMGHVDLIAGLERVKNSFNSYPVDVLAQAAAVASFGDQAYFDMAVTKVINSRQWLGDQLQALGFTVLPSATNFILVCHATANSSELQQTLRQKNILTRYFNQPRIQAYLRITIGTQEECEALVGALREILGA